MATDDPERPDREVGYGRPPVAKQWKKGRSGNPRGRPRKPRAGMPFSPQPELHLTLLEEGNRLIEIKQDGKRMQIPLITGVVRALGVSAANGSLRAQLAYAEMYQAAEKQRYKEMLASVGSWLDYKHKWYAEFERYDRAGAPRPEPLPHPDDIAINYITGDIIWNGPRTKEEAKEWQRERQRYDAEEERLPELWDRLRANPDHRESIQAEMDEIQDRMDAIDRMYPSESLRRGGHFNLIVWRGMDRHRDKDGRLVFD